MRNEPSFSEILESMNEPETGPGLQFSSGWESHLDPFGMAQLLAGHAVSPSANIVFPKAYAAFKARPTPRPQPRKAHSMDSAQRDAYAEIRRHCANLSDAFTANELKSAFRLCALKTHPDRGGSSETFQLIKKSYHILEALVKN
jgi:hypothetical protein